MYINDIGAFAAEYACNERRRNRESNPYLVSSPSDLNAIHNDLDGYYKLTCDIDMNGVAFTTIGNENEGAFTGTIDGNGYSIKNLNLDLPNDKYVGLVGYLEGTVKNVKLENANVIGCRYIGGIVGYTASFANVNNCLFVGFATNETYFQSSFIGGITGYSNGDITNCDSYGTLIANYNSKYVYIGGVSGYVKGNISECNNHSNISSQSTSYLAGIAGQSQGNISNCNNFGRVTTSGRSTYAGGIAGNGNTIEFCCNYGEIVGGVGASGYSTYTGGICGSAQVINCINYGTISRFSDENYSYSHAGGISGICGYSSDGARIVNCVNQGIINSSTYAGGIVGATSSGYWYNPGEISNCLNFDKSMIGYTAYSDFTHMAGKASNSINLSSSSVIVGGFEGTTANIYDWKENGVNADVDDDKHLSTELLKSTNSYENIDFENTWAIDSSINSGFPLLKDLPRHIDLNQTAMVMNIGDSVSLKAYIDNTSIGVSWESNNSNVTVNSNGVVTALKTGDAIVTAKNTEGMIANCFIRIVKPVSSIRLEESDLLLKAGYSYSLSYVENPSDGNEEVIWKSTNPDIASVTQEGTIKGIKRGITTISCETVSTGCIAYCSVSVVGNPITRVSSNSSTRNLNVGEVYSSAFRIEPTEYSGTMTYISSNDSVATVSNSGEITGVSNGTAIITATSDTGYSATCTVTVKAPATDITLNKNELTLEKGFTEKLIPSVLPVNSTDTISWSTSSSTYASISQDGTVTANRAGQATITATTASGKKAYCVVNVVEPTISVSSVTLNKTSLMMTKADSAQLSATVLPSNATNKDLTWTSSDESVATVSNTGFVTAISTGSAIITATSNNGYYHECSVQVIAANGASVVAASTKAGTGETAEYTVSVVRNPGIAAYKFSLDYDESLLDAVEIIPNADFGGTFSTNIDDADRSVLNVLWYADENVSVNADLFTVRFKVSDDAQNDTTIPVALSYSAGDICNTAHDNLAFFVNNTEIEVFDALIGDLYEDGEINVHDILILSRYLTGLETLSARQMRAANVFSEDSIVDIKDIIKLAQIILNTDSRMNLMSARLMSIPQGTPTAKVHSAKLNDAGEVLIPVEIQNNSGMAGFRFAIDYNSDELEILSITPNDEMLTDTFNTNLGSEDENGLLVTWYKESDLTENGTLFTIKAKAKDGFTRDVSPISISYAKNNISNATPANVETEYVAGYVMRDTFIRSNDVVSSDKFTCDLFFDDSFDEQPAVAMIAYYDANGKLLNMAKKDITITSGKQPLEFDVSSSGYDHYKVFVWDGVGTMRPLVGVK